MSEWVSVKERLPKEKEGCLIGWFHDGDKRIEKAITLANIDCAYQIGYIRDYGYKIEATIAAGGVDNNYVSLSVDAPPTHWMPLPEPPK